MSDSSSSMRLADQNIQRRRPKTFPQLQRPKSSWSNPSNPWNSRCLVSSFRLTIFLPFFFQFIFGISSSNSTFNGEFVHQNSSKLTDILARNNDPQFELEIDGDHRRQKRQWSGGLYGQPQSMMCPPQCFQCSPMHCQAYQCVQPQVVNMMRCCCRPAIIVHSQSDLKTACDGEEAVAACLNGLCGQGFFCNARKFCCRCQNGKSLGQCVNGLCPVGYACNTNNFCCAIGAGSVLGPCINGKCPEGYECGAGKLCYARTSNTPLENTVLPSIRRSHPPIRRNRPKWGSGFGSGISSGGKRRRTQRGRGNGGWSHRRFGSEGDDWWQQEAAEFIQKQTEAEDY